MGTCADLLDAELPFGAADDSVSILPLLQGKDVAVRSFAVHHSSTGRFAIRKGCWVFIDAPSGDENQEPQWLKDQRRYSEHDDPGELFNLEEDISERENRYRDHPEIVRELSALLDEVKRRGR
jgi:arylsulfatase A